VGEASRHSPGERRVLGGVRGPEQEDEREVDGVAPGSEELLLAEALALGREEERPLGTVTDIGDDLGERPIVERRLAPALVRGASPEVKPAAVAVEVGDVEVNEALDARPGDEKREKDRPCRELVRADSVEPGAHGERERDLEGLARAARPSLVPGHVEPRPGGERVAG
jgi:hypothetical protein